MNPADGTGGKLTAVQSCLGGLFGLCLDDPPAGWPACWINVTSFCAGALMTPRICPAQHFDARQISQRHDVRGFHAGIIQIAKLDLQLVVVGGKRLQAFAAAETSF